MKKARLRLLRMVVGRHVGHESLKSLLVPPSVNLQLSLTQGQMAAADLLLAGHAAERPRRMHLQRATRLLQWMRSPKSASFASEMRAQKAPISHLRLVSRSKVRVAGRQPACQKRFLTCRVHQKQQQLQNLQKRHRNPAVRLAETCMLH